MKKRKVLTALIMAVTLVFTGTGSVMAAKTVKTGEDLQEKDGKTKEDLQEKEESGSKPATDITAEKNKEWYDILDFDDTQEAEFAKKGLIDAPEELDMKDKDGLTIWSQKAYDFLDDYDEAPDSANPSLWENTKNNHAYGLFEVTDGIYQVRGYDMANVTFIEGDTGWIIFDTGMGKEVAQAARELVEKNLGERPVKAVLISHPHVDHFGGIRAFVSEDELADSSLSLKQQVKSGDIPIIVPEGFTEHAVEENLYAGTAMSRRSKYQYGVFLDKGPTGALAMGIGLGQSRGTLGFITPTYEVKKTGEKITIDGVDIEFQLTPGTEAPAEMNAYFPQKKALWVAENCTGTLHNLYTLRGAEVRDGNDWARYIMEAYALYGDDVEVTFQSHNWPHWGNDVVKEYLINTAAVYKYINDETLSMLNMGYTSTEIANTIKLPEKLAKNWYTRQYYGTVAHDSKAVYQKYMGWYDANPINLAKLTPEETAKKWVQYLELGGVDEAMEKAHEEYDKGEYQWVAEFTNTLVFADPDNKEARELCADSLEQLGYQTESGTWRNCYLTAAAELRGGNLSVKDGPRTFGSDLMSHLTPEMTFDYMAILLDKEEIEDEDYCVEFNITDTDETYTLWVRYGSLLYAKAPTDDADVVISCTQKALLTLISGESDRFKDIADIEGDTKEFDDLLANLDRFAGGSNGDFNIIEP